jgi:hypothetical protein
MRYYMISPLLVPDDISQYMDNANLSSRMNQITSGNFQ